MLPIQDNGGSGTAVSANSKVLYVTNGDTLYQFDLTASNINATRQIVGVYDGYMSPLWTTFNLAYLAPDNKIYISTTNGCNVLHVINNPDSLGLACDFQQHSIPLPFDNGFTVPHFPNYRLTALAEPCDTTSSVQSAVNSKQVQVYPNPAQGYVQVELPQGEREGIFVLYNALGQVIQRKSLQASTLVPLGFAKGLYFYEVIFKEGKVSGKLQVE